MDETGLKEVLKALRLEQNDNRQYEAKSAANGFPKSAAKTICAFANTPGGGTILFGIDEKRNFAVTGVYDAKNCQQTLAHYAQREYSLPILVDISLIPLDGKSIVVADVHEAKKNMKPVRYKKTDSSFIRQYDSDFELSALEELMFESNQGIVRYDEEPVSKSSAADLNQTLTEGYIANRKRHSDVLAGISNDDVLLRTGIVLHSGELSVAGLLALGIYPQQHFPNYTIKASVRTKAKTSLDARAVNVTAFDGPIPTMLESALRWVSSNSDEYTLDLSDGNVAAVGEYPSVTTRELLANSLIHRSLSPVSMIETISLTIEDNRLILSNPGGLFGISVNELGQSASRTRNSRLAEICQFVPAAGGANIIEKLGSGIPKMYAEQDRYGFKRPRFIDGEIYFTSILPKGEPAKTQHGIPSQNQNTMKILSALSDGALSRAEIERRTMLTQSQVRYALSKLMKKQQVSRIGEGKDPNIVYMLSSDE